MTKFRKINKNHEESICTTEGFEGQSLEQKVFQAVNTKAPIEAIAPMVYTERKEGVLPETNIRTDRFELAQEGMTTIATGIREKRAKRMLDNVTEKPTDKPVSGSGESSPTTSVQNN